MKKLMEYATILIVGIGAWFWLMAHQHELMQYREEERIHELDIWDAG
jgi:hypothetical protein